MRGPAPAIPPPPNPPSDPPLRLRYAGFELAIKGARAIYAIGLLGCVLIFSRVIPPLVDAASELSASMRASAITLRQAGEDAAAAREGVERIGAAQSQDHASIVRIADDVSALRVDVSSLRTTCSTRR